MYTITITENPVCIAHRLKLPYDSKCNTLHGHNYVVEVVITSPELNATGMVIDFTHVKEVIKKYDHSFLGNPGFVSRTALDELGITTWFAHVEPSTAENFATTLFLEIVDRVKKANPQAIVKSVAVWETPSSKVVVEV